MNNFSKDEIDKITEQIDLDLETIDDNSPEWNQMGGIPILDTFLNDKIGDLIGGTPLEGPIKNLQKFTEDLREKGENTVKVFDIEKVVEKDENGQEIERKRFHINDENPFIEIVVALINAMLPFSEDKKLDEILAMFKTENIVSTVSLIFGTLLVHLCKIMQNIEGLYNRMPLPMKKMAEMAMSQPKIPLLSGGAMSLNEMKQMDMGDAVMKVDLDQFKKDYEKLPDHQKKFGKSLDFENLDKEQIFAEYKKLPKESQILGDDPEKYIEEYTNQKGGESVVLIICIVILVIVIYAIYAIAIVAVIAIIAIVVICVVAIIAIVIIAVVIVVALAVTVIAVVAVIAIVIIAIVLIQNLQPIIATLRAPDDDMTELSTVYLKNYDFDAAFVSVDNLTDTSPQLIGQVTEASKISGQSFGVIGDVAGYGTSGVTQVSTTATGNIADVGVAGVGAVASTGSMAGTAGNAGTGAASAVASPQTTGKPMQYLGTASRATGQVANIAGDVGEVTRTVGDVAQVGQEVYRGQKQPAQKQYYQQPPVQYPQEQRYTQAVQAAGAPRVVTAQQAEQSAPPTEGIDPKTVDVLDPNQPVKLESFCDIIETLVRIDPTMLNSQEIKQAIQNLDTSTLVGPLAIFKILFQTFYIVFTNLERYFGPLRNGEVRIPSKEDSRKAYEASKDDEVMKDHLNLNRVVENITGQQAGGGTRKRKRRRRYKLMK